MGNIGVVWLILNDISIIQKQNHVKNLHGLVSLGKFGIILKIVLIKTLNLKGCEENENNFETLL